VRDPKDDRVRQGCCFEDDSCAEPRASRVRSRSELVLLGVAVRRFVKIEDSVDVVKEEKTVGPTSRVMCTLLTERTSVHCGC